MDQLEHEIGPATDRANRRRARQPHALAARYDSAQGRIVIDLSTGYAVAFAPERAQGLASARPADLADIEITPSGYGLHFPKLDADLWLPALLEGVFGSRAWTAAHMGARGGRAKSDAKATAARANGKLGGRPTRKPAATRSKTIKQTAGASTRKAHRPPKRGTHRTPSRASRRRG
jgi:Protein of unknown function (DUF2442)